MKAQKDIEKKIISALSDVVDPELNISIVDLGLIYQVRENKGKVKILMTLTTIGCPLFSIIENQIKEKALTVEGVREVEVKLVFNPPWTIDRMSKKAKMALGI